MATLAKNQGPQKKHCSTVAPDRLAIESPNENSIWCAPVFFYWRNFAKKRKYINEVIFNRQN
jgi:hypothetical protein